MTESRRTTVYLEPDLHRALRLKSVETDCSISDLVNAAVRQSLVEDAEDLAAFEFFVHWPHRPMGVRRPDKVSLRIGHDKP